MIIVMIVVTIMDGYAMEAPATSIYPSIYLLIQSINQSIYLLSFRNSLPLNATFFFINLCFCGQQENHQF